MTLSPPKLSDESRARIVEIFSSFQGEGPRVGERQIFVRFGGCNLRCDYCDEPDTIAIPSGQVLSIERVKARIRSLNRRRRHRTISWTGGEPLLHRTFLAPMLSWARGLGFENYLETNGTLPAAMRALAPLCDVVSMDVKLPSSIGRATWSQHEAFLREAPRGTFIKVVLTSRTTDAEWRRVLALLRNAPREIPLILQPATDFAGVKPLALSKCRRFRDLALRVVSDVRVMPQWHHIWQVR